MATRNKYKPDVSLEDVQFYIREHREETGYDAALTLVFPVGSTEACAQVQLRKVGDALSTPAVVSVSGPYPVRAMSRQMSALLRLVAEAYQNIQASPWLWTQEQRRRVVEQPYGELPAQLLHR